jgi:hypothetical protein
MSTNTTNYKLIKPDRTDNVLVEDINYNTEIIDQELKRNATSIINLPSTYVLKTDLATETIKGISQLATQSEVNAGVDDSKIVTSKKLKALFGGSNVNLATNGYYKLPNGLVFQWGTASYRSSNGLNGEVLNYPVNFPNGLLGIGAVDGGSNTNTIGFQEINKAQFKCWGRDIVTNNFSNTVFRWIAIGY